MSNNSYSVYSEFVKPFKFNKVDLDDNYTRFMLYPMERGYGVTIGNAMRRVLMSSIRGVCVAAVKIDGTKHEFSVIDGVVEDFISIGLNLRHLILRMDDSNEVIVTTSLKGPMKVCAKDINFPESVSVLNPDEYLFTISSDVSINLSLKILAGFGSELSKNVTNVDDIGWVNLNRYYSPVLNVSFSVEDARHAEYINYDKLILDVKTNGSASPSEAVGIATALLREMLNPLVSIEDLLITSSMSAEKVAPVSVVITEPIDKPVDHVEFSVRTTNCLKKMSITHLSELAQKSPMKLLSMKNFGRKSLNEVIQKLSENGFKLLED